MEKTYLCLYPDTFLWNKNGEGMIYNSINNCGFRFNNDAIEETAKALNNLKNLYCVEINKLDTRNPEQEQFIANIQKCKAGELVKLSASSPSPVVFPPLLNLQSEIGRLQKESAEMVGENMLDYLHELTIWINTDSKHSGIIENIDYDILSNILRSASFSSIAHIHIKGTDIHKFPEVMKLIDILDRMHIKKSIHIKMSNLEHEMLSKNIFSSLQFALVVEVDNYENTEKIDEFARIINKSDINSEWTFQVQNEEEYQIVEMLVKEHQLLKCEIKPVFTGYNLKFFEENIYLTEEDLQSPGLSKREVFAHQTLNTNDFGKLTITADGKVYANPYFPALGTIEDDIRELIYKEMVQGTSWRHIRDMKPCCDCIYQWLCPSPSNYELTIGKPNLCHVKPFCSI